MQTPSTLQVAYGTQRTESSRRVKLSQDFSVKRVGMAYRPDLKENILSLLLQCLPGTRTVHFNAYQVHV